MRAVRARHGVGVAGLAHRGGDVDGLADGDVDVAEEGVAHEVGDAHGDDAEPEVGPRGHGVEGDANGARLQGLDAEARVGLALGEDRQHAALREHRTASGECIGVVRARPAVVAAPPEGDGAHRAQERAEQRDAKEPVARAEADLALLSVPRRSGSTMELGWLQARMVGSDGVDALAAGDLDVAIKHLHRRPQGGAQGLIERADGGRDHAPTIAHPGAARAPIAVDPQQRPRRRRTAALMGAGATGARSPAPPAPARARRPAPAAASPDRGPRSSRRAGAGRPCSSARARNTRLRSPWDSCQPVSPTGCSSPPGMRAMTSSRPSAAQTARASARSGVAGRPGTAHQEVEGEGAQEDVVLVELRRRARHAGATRRRRGGGGPRRRAAPGRPADREGPPAPPRASTCRRPSHR